MLARASFAAAVAACAVLLTSSANAWGLTGKTLESPKDSHILPTSSAGSPEQVQDHYWWNVKTGTHVKYPASCADSTPALAAFRCAMVAVKIVLCHTGAVQWNDPNPVHQTGTL